MEVEDKNARNSLNITERWNALTAWEASKRTAPSRDVEAGDITARYELEYYYAWGGSADEGLRRSDSNGDSDHRGSEDAQRRTVDDIFDENNKKSKATIATIRGAPESLRTAWGECQDLRKAILDNDDTRDRLIAAVSGVEVRLAVGIPRIHIRENDAEFSYNFPSA